MIHVKRKVVYNLKWHAFKTTDDSYRNSGSYHFLDKTTTAWFISFLVIKYFR